MLENRHVKIEYVSIVPDTWDTMLHFNTTRAGVVQAFKFVADLEDRMLLLEGPADVRITVTNEVLGYEDTRFAEDGDALRELLEGAWRYGFSTVEPGPAAEE